jgi:hypothetical protein
MCGILADRVFFCKPAEKRAGGRMVHLNCLEMEFLRDSHAITDKEA